jgi:CelD/BcsL family acetyltransferase involved in cellulose biosynthesis
VEAAWIAPFRPPASSAAPPSPPAATAEDGAWRVERLSAPADLERLRGEWDALLAASRSDSLFLTPEWLLTWWRHLGGGRRPALYAVRCGDRLAALAPLAAASGRRLPPAPALGFLGTGAVGSDDLDVVVRAGAEHAALAALADHLDRERRLVELAQLPRVGSAAALLAGLLERRGWRALERVTGVCPWIDLADRSWEDYLAGLGASHRANFRRRLRKLERRFDLRFEQVADPGRLGPAFDAFLRLHLARWDGRGGSDALGDPAVAGFHRELTRRALERGWLRLYLLHLDGRPAAALYGFLYRGRFLFYQSGFDPAFAAWGVGLVTMGLAIRAAIADGARAYDLLHGAEPYKFLWASRSRELARLELYPPTLGGALYRCLREPLRAARGAVQGAAAGAARSRAGAWLQAAVPPRLWPRAAAAPPPAGPGGRAG